MKIGKNLRYGKIGLDRVGAMAGYALNGEYSITVRCIMVGLVLMSICGLGLLVPASAEAVVIPGHTGHCPVLRLHSEGPCVTALQRRLNTEHSRPHLKVDGSFGRLTVKAVKGFQ